MAQRWDNVVDIAFGLSGHDSRNLSGWAEPAWTIGHAFTIELGPVPRRARSFVRLTGTTYLEQSFSLSCNGVKLGHHTATGSFVATFPLPDGTIAANGCLLAIWISSPKRPCDHSSSADKRLLGLALERIELIGTNAPVAAVWPSNLPILTPAETNDRAILSLFESLGDNCEFGFVQKRRGVEGSALLRFCATPADRLLQGLSHGFSGIADPQSVILVEDGPLGAMEYQIHLSRYDLHYHTLVFTHEAAREDVLRRETSKLSYKHTKFIAGLASANRIYVLKRNDGLPLATIWSVWLALQHFGENTLLYVRVAKAQEPVGVVRVLAPGLLEATISGFAHYTDATIDNDAEWIGICRGAYSVATNQASSRCPPD